MAEEAPEVALAEVKEAIEEAEVAVQDESSKTEEESAKPEAEGARPEDESAKPQAESAEPDDESIIPQEESIIPQEESIIPQEESIIPQDESIIPQVESAKPEDEAQDEHVSFAEVIEEILVPQDSESQDTKRPAEGELGEEPEYEVDTEIREITAEEHEENIAAMGEVMHLVLDMAAEGKLPTKKEKVDFEMKAKTDSTEDLLALHTVDIEEEVKHDEFKSPEGSSEEKLGEEEEEEEEESASVQEAWHKRQQLLEEFDAVHDEAQRLRIMNMLLHSKVLRAMQRRPKGTKSTVSQGSSSMRAAPQIVDTAAMAESLEKELLEAGEVRRQLDAELHRGATEEALRQRLSDARQLVEEKGEYLEQLQEKAMTKLRATPLRRQEAERMMKRVWPQLLRLRKERLMHTRAKHELESAKKQVSELEVFGQQRTVAAYEQLSADGVKLAERVQERSEQLAALRNIAVRDLQQAAHLRESLQGAHQAVIDARRSDVRTSSFLQRARQEVLKLKKQRDVYYKESSKLSRQMELLAYPELLRDHEEVRRRLRVALVELEKLRAVYTNQEKRIAAARQLLVQREHNLRHGTRRSSDPDRAFAVLRMDAKCGPSLLGIRRGH